MELIKYLIMDVDGTLTDGKLYIGNTGELMKSFSVKDGYGIRDIAICNNIVPIILTSRQSDIVLNRCRELGITCVYQGVQDKKAKLKSILPKFSDVAYIGDDLNDMSCMIAIKEAGGKIGCPKDAVKDVVDFSDFVSAYKGGDGAVREFIEWIVMYNKKISNV